MRRPRPLVILVSFAVVLCLMGLWRARSQSGTIRRVTTTTEEGININPSLSGDGRRIAFESTEDIAHAGGTDHFRALRADLGTDPATFVQMAGSRSPAPGISQDGSVIAFASKDDPLGTNTDGNSEIFLFNGATLRQITNTTPVDPSTRIRDGNFQPSLTDDGRFIAFSSNRNLAGQNSDGNLEIIVFDTTTNTFTQLTNTAGIVGASDAKISGDGTRVAYIRDSGATASTQRDLVLQDRTGGTSRVLASNATNLALTFGRAISDDGSRVVYSADVATDSSQVFLYDGRTTNTSRQITALGVRTTEVPLDPTISGDGTRLAFATRRTVTGFSNSDASIELYTYDIPTGTFGRITSAPSNADCFDGSTRVCEVVSSLNDDGSVVAFNFPRSLSGTVTSGMENNAEIYVTGTTPRPTVGTLTILNEASFGHEPATDKAIAPESNASALGGALAFTTEQPQKQNGSFPTTVGGTTVTVNGRRAQISFVSPTRVNFIVPAATELGTAEVIVTNSEGFQSKGTVPIVKAAPGIFTYSGDGSGEAVVLNADTLQPGPFDPTNGNLRLIIFTTGLRRATQVTATAGGRALTVESFVPSPDMPGMDEVHVLVPSDLRGAGPATLVVRADSRDSNPALITFSGNACRDIVINEVLADPPDGTAGDANLDGVRSGTDDEFVELVNTTGTNIDIGGYQLLTRSSTTTTDTVRHTFPAGTLFPAGSAIVIFGGGNFNPTNPAFGGAQVFKASSSSGLSLNNAGGTVTLRTPTQSIVNIFTYGGSTGLDGDANQSLTRSPDAGGGTCGQFVLHSSAPGSGGRPFSPGRRVDGTPFAPGIPRLTSVTISPSSTTITVGQTTQFTAQARDQFNRVLTGITITFASDNTGVATVDSVTTDQSTGIATATVTGRSVGTAHITAQATDGTTTVTSNQSTLSVIPQNSATLSINDVSASEGNAGTTTFTFTVSLSQPAPASGVTFDIATADGTATAASGDYVAKSLTGQTIPAGQQTYTFTVAVNGDTLVEPDETFFVNVTNISAAAISDGQGQGTIQNDDAANLVISQTYPGGGLTNAIYRNDFIEIFNRGTTTVNFALTPYSVQFLSTGGTTWVKTDLTTGVIAPGQYFLVQETSGGSAGATLPTPDATGNINLTSTTPGKIALVLGTTLLTGNCPGDDGIQPFNPAGFVDFVGYGGTAATSSHCYEGAGPASFTSGSNTTADFRKSGGCTDTNNNAADFLISAPFPRNISSPANSCLAGPTPNLTINDVTAAEGNSGTTTFTFTVSLSAPAPSTDITFDIATADGTATTANNDYVAKSLTSQVIPAGVQTYTFTVTVNGDTTTEPDETFFVNVTNVSGANLLDGQGVGTIQNDDLPALSINDVSANEGNTGTTAFTFTVSLSSPAPSGGVTFNIATADGTATVADNDYIARSLTNQTIPAGQQTYTFDVTVNGDVNIEPNETFTVNVTNVSGANVIDGQGQGTIQNDDSPSLSINDVSKAEGNSGTTTFTFTVSLTQPAGAGGVTFDIATADGTATTANNDYLAKSLTGQIIPAGQQTYKFDVTVNGDTAVESNETFTVNVTNVSGATVADGVGLGTIQNDDAANLVISQIYQGGGLTNATYKNDFIEIFNKGATTVDFSVTPYSVQFLSTSGSTWAKTDITSGTIAPGQYFLIQETSGGSAGATLPTPDATGTINITSTTPGKVALVSGTTLLTGSCPGDDGTSPFNPTGMVDFVGYGGTAATANHCYEGSGPATYTTSNNTIADFRKAGGCTDTNDNSADFFTATPAPRNTSSPSNSCSAGTPPTLSITDVSAAEGNTGTTTFTFTVSLSAPAPSTDVFFDIATADGTATTANSDYVAKSLTSQVIPAGQPTYTFSVTVNGDTNVEPDETFFVNVTNVSGATVADWQGLGTILNDDLPSLSINDVTQLEGNSGTTTFAFTVSLSAPATSTVTFDIATADGTATVADNDYAAKSLTSQTITAGNQTYTFDVTVNGDTAVEPNETFFVNVTNISGATAADTQGHGNIQNDDSPGLSINDVSQAEGNTGTSTFKFTVSLSQPAPAGGVTFDIATADGTAIAGSDYVARSLAGQTIPAGQQTYSFDVTVNGDTTVEPNETFLVNITNVNGATLLDGQGTGTINNDDTANLVISQVYGGGNNSGATYQNDFVEIFNRGTTTIDFSVTPYSVQYAGVGSNFGTSKTNLASGTIAPGQYFLVQESGGTSNGVALPTPDATGNINMGNTSGKVALVVGTTALTTSTCPGDDGSSPFNPVDATIADFVGYGSTSTTTGHCYEGSGPAAAPSNSTSDFRKAGGCTDTNVNSADFLVSTPFPRNTSSPLNTCSAGATPNLTINDVSLAEGNTGTTTFNFTVSLSAPSPSTDITFDIATADGTATTGNSDYVAKTLTSQVIPAGVQTYTFSVTVNGDTTVEPDETFFVNVTNVSGANVTDGQGQGTIQNDDLPTLSINDVSQNEGNSGTTTFSFTVSLSSPAPAGGVSFTVNTADGTATAPGDYTAIVSGSGSITAGNSSTTVSVTVNGDTTVEPNETFFVNISNVTGATLADGQGQGTIQNDDSPAISINDVTVTEGNSGTTNATFTVSLSQSSNQTITVDYATADGTAKAPSDYTAISTTTLTFNPTETTKQITVLVNGDTTNEAICETFFVNLSNATNATIADSQGQGSITDDDGTKLVISQIYGGGGNAGPPVATYRNDFIELFNRGNTNISLNGLSVQYAPATGTTGSYSVTALPNVTLQPGQYYLIQEASNGSNGSTLPNPDLVVTTGAIDLAGTAGRVALVNGTTALSRASCPTGATILDFVGYGTTAICREGASTSDNAPAPSNILADIRNQGGCQDTGNNNNDFTAATPNPRNTATALNPCSCSTSYSSMLIFGVDSWKEALAFSLDEGGTSSSPGGGMMGYLSYNLDRFIPALYTPPRSQEKSQMMCRGQAQ